MFNKHTAHYGYYKVNNYCTFSVIDALEKHPGKEITWHFNDDIFSQCDWLTEPKESLVELYARRAHQLRAKYEYIVLLFSGGADSMNMLMSFVNAGIKIDEIAVFSTVDGDHDKYSKNNKEITITALPFVKNLKETNLLYKDTVIRIIEFSPIIATMFNNTESKAGHKYFANTLSPYSFAMDIFKEKVPAYQAIMSQKKTAFIYGMEKPLAMQVRSGKFYFKFKSDDTAMGAMSKYLNKDNNNVEIFYNTPDLPEITIKQCHQIKSFLLKAQVPHPWLTLDPMGLVYIKKVYNNKFVQFHLTLNGLHNLIYPYYNSDYYSEGKILNTLFSTRIDWFFKDITASTTYFNIVNGLYKKFGDKWLSGIEAMGDRAINNYNITIKPKSYFTKEYQF